MVQKDYVLVWTLQALTKGTYIQCLAQLLSMVACGNVMITPSYIPVETPKGNATIAGPVWVQLSTVHRLVC